MVYISYWLLSMLVVLLFKPTCIVPFGTKGVIFWRDAQYHIKRYHKDHKVLRYEKRAPTDLSNRKGDEISDDPRNKN